MKKNEWIAVIVVMFVVALAVSFLTINLITGGVIRVAEAQKGISIYSKVEIDSKLANIYTKTEVDKKVSSGGVTSVTTPTSVDSYSRAEVDSKLANIYTKTDVDTRINVLHSSQAEISGIKLLAGHVYTAYPYNLELGQDNGFGRVTIAGEFVTKPIAPSGGQELFYVCSGADGQIYQSSSACR